jgi:hypothetical protein
VRPTSTDALSALLPSPWVHTTRAVSVSLLRLRGAPALTGACRAVAGAGSFVVDSGPCTVDSTAACFRSPNYPSNYANSQLCTITTHEAVMLSVTAFSTEAGFDRLTVNGVQYSGTTGPDGVHVSAGSTITWTSDGSVRGAGFEICGEAPTTSPTTITPTITGQTWTPTTSAPTSPTVSPTTSPTTTPNTLENNGDYQACIASPSFCRRLYVPPSSVTVPSRTRVARTQLSSHEVAVTPRRGWRSRCSHTVVRALVLRGWLLGGS